MIEIKKISGVHNYCNRWCERCDFVNRCEVGLHEQKAKEKRLTSSNEDVWETVHNNLEEAFDLLKEMLQEMEGDIKNAISEELENTEIPTPDHLPASDTPQPPLFNHINEASKKYGFEANSWFQDNNEILKSKENQLKQLHIIGAKHIPQNAEIINEAISVVQWNMFLIGAKINRATRKDEFPMIDKDPIQNDAHGSAKVALIAIDDSLAAWNTIREMIPELSDQLLDMLASLSRLKKDTLKAFPNAHKFIRPGFDDGQ